MTKTLPTILLAGAIVLLAVVLLYKPLTTGAAGYLGYATHLQSATTTTVGTTPVTLFAGETSATCHARVVTTTDRPITISFGETVVGFSSTTLTATVGHYQAGSTTVAYESGIYGCGTFTAYAGASTVVTVSSF
jgi:hypothetical protein